MITQEDMRRLIEARHDLAATAQSAELTEEAPLQAALAFTHARLTEAFTGLERAVATANREAGETTSERIALAAASSTAEAEYRYLRGRVEQALLNPPPEERPDALEMERRQDLVDRLFPKAPADFGRMTADAKVLVLETLTFLAGLPTTGDLGGAAALIQQRLPPVTAKLKLRNGEHKREIREDRDAIRDLNKARALFDRRLAAHTLQVDTVLTDAGRADIIGRYVLAQDAAYRARRASRRSIKEEKDLDTVTTALGATPDDIEDAPADA